MPEQEKKLIEKYSNWMRALITFGVLLLCFAYIADIADIDTVFLPKKFAWYFIGGGCVCFVGGLIAFLMMWRYKRLFLKKNRKDKALIREEKKRREEIINQLPLEFREQYTIAESGLKSTERWLIFAGVIGIVFGIVTMAAASLGDGIDDIVYAGIFLLCGAFFLFYLGSSYNDKRTELKEAWDRIIDMIQSGNISVEEAVRQLNAVLRQEEQKGQVQQMHTGNLTPEEAQMLELLLKKAQNQNRNQ